MIRVPVRRALRLGDYPIHVAFRLKTGKGLPVKQGLEREVKIKTGIEHYMKKLSHVVEGATANQVTLTRLLSDGGLSQSVDCQQGSCSRLRTWTPSYYNRTK